MRTSLNRATLARAETHDFSEASRDVRKLRALDEFGSRRALTNENRGVAAVFEFLASRGPGQAGGVSGTGQNSRSCASECAATA